MEKKIRYTLGKNERLKSRKAIDELFINGKSFLLFPFKITWKVTTSNQQPANTDSLQAAFSVGKRNFKKATERNKIKRLIREAWRLQKNELKYYLQQNNKQAVVFILFIGNEIPEYKLVSEKVNATLKKLHRITDEDVPSNM